MIAENLRHLLSRKFGELSRYFSECRIIWCKDGQIRFRVNGLDQVHGLQGSHNACQSTSKGGDRNWRWNRQHTVDDVDQAAVKINVLPESTFFSPSGSEHSLP